MDIDSFWSQGARALASTMQGKRTLCPCLQTLSISPKSGKERFIESQIGDSRESRTPFARSAFL